MEEQKPVVYGNNWCPACRAARRFLDANGFAYTWVDIENSKTGRAIVLEINKGNASVPTIVFPDGSILVEPSMIALNKKFRPD